MEGKNNKKLKKSKKKIQTLFKTTDMLGLIIITCIISLFAGAFFGTRFLTNEHESETYKVLDQIKDVYVDIKENYYKETNDEDLINGAINGMIAALDDPYATYLTDDNSNSFDAQLQGSYEGIGIEIFNNTEGDIEILTVFENTSAAKAGLQPGDIIIGINDEDVSKQKTSDLVSKISELKDDSFTIKILRNGEEQQLKVTRKKVELTSVTSKVINKDNKKIGYIKISIFSLNTYSQFSEQLKKLENNKIDSLIIDVRGNTGGHLSTVDDILSLFLDKKHVIYQIETKGEKEKFYSSGKVTKEYPIVILTDSYSASASELLAISLKEEYGAATIGTTTYGKGTVQELKTMDSGEYKFTTKKWLSPKGNWINEKGVEPTIEVTLDENYYKNPTEENDNQLQKAIEYLMEK